jgi:steroid 5-alpha reductase family enzyme
MNWSEVGKLLAIGWPIAAAVMGALWLLQTRTRDATSVDIAWSALLGLFAVVYARLGDGDTARRALVAATVACATWRLALHLYTDRARAGREDGRYAKLRSEWGASAQRNFFLLFQTQAVLAVALSLPFALACTSTASLGALDFAALALWCAGLVGEGVADRQLARFKRDPANRGRTCRVGLWRYSRHPNYFFQWCLWIAYAVFGLSAPWGAVGFAAPVAMLGLILFVTGIPPTEAQALRSRGDDYREYQRTTSAFVPWFPSQVKRTN